MSFVRRAGAEISRIIARAADPAAELGRLLLYSRSVAGVTQLFARSSDGTIHQLTPLGSTAILLWGNDSIAAAADTRFLYCGRSTSTAPTTAITSFRSPRAGTLRNFRVRHNSAVGNGNSVVYDVLVNGVAAGLALALATGAVGDASNLVFTIAIASGDLIQLRAVKALAIGAGGINTQFACEFGA